MGGNPAAAKSAAKLYRTDFSEGSNLRYPDFLCIGAQKAGTTWIDKNLRRHPRLWLPPIKELQYFTEIHVPASRVWTGDLRQRRGKQVLHNYLDKTARENLNYHLIGRLADIVTGPVSDEWYGRIFALAPNERICGEITPDYCTLPEEGIRHVLRLSPQVKIILSLRDPIERSWSHIRMLAKARNSEDVETFERFAQHADILKRADYPSIIANWRKHVPEERFHVLMMDDFTSAPDAALEKMCRFLGVPFLPKRFKKAENPIHVGSQLAMPNSVETILKNRLRPLYDGLGDLFPEVAAEWMARNYGTA